MTQAEIDDIFGEFEIDEDYMIKSKDVIGLLLQLKKKKRKKRLLLQWKKPRPLQKKMRVKLRRRRRRRRRLPSKCYIRGTSFIIWSLLLLRRKYHERFSYRRSNKVFSII